MVILFAGTRAAHSVFSSVITATAPTVLVSSQLTTTIANSASGNTVTTVISSNPGSAILAIDPQTKMIWNGDCASEIVINEQITVPCGYGLTYIIYSTADVQFFNGLALVPGNYTRSATANMLATACSTYTRYIDQLIPTVLTFRTGACVPGVTSISYVFYATPPSPARCPPGCLVCTPDFLSCTSCLQHSYRVAAPDATAQCPCLDGFYMDPNT